MSFLLLELECNYGINRGVYSWRCAMKLIEQVKTTMKFARVSPTWGLVGGLLLLVVTLSTGCIKTTGASV